VRGRRPWNSSGLPSQRDRDRPRRYAGLERRTGSPGGRSSGCVASSESGSPERDSRPDRCGILRHPPQSRHLQWRHWRTEILARLEKANQEKVSRHPRTRSRARSSYMARVARLEPQTLPPRAATARPAGLRSGRRPSSARGAATGATDDTSPVPSPPSPPPRGRPAPSTGNAGSDGASRGEVCKVERWAMRLRAGGGVS
jgi:hypothetical protein